MGMISPVGSLRFMSGARPIPEGESCFIIEKAHWARASRFWKWVDVSIEGVNQYPSYRTQEEG